MEHWLPVVGWEGLYEVSDMGNVRSIGRRWNTSFGERSYAGLFLHRIDTPKHYLVVNLTDPGRRSQRLVHLLVLESFVGPRPPGMQGCHDDGDPSNAALSNLRWDTIKANHYDKIRHGTSGNGKPKLNQMAVRQIRDGLLDWPQAHVSFGINRNTFDNARLGRSWGTVA